MSRRANFTVALLFAVFIGGFFLANVVCSDQTFSPQENRELQTMPKFSFPSLFRGEFTAKMETYSSDQFILRDRWIELKARLELMQGKKANNGVFLCADGRLIEPFSGVEESELLKKAGYVETLSDGLRVPVTLALIPSAAELYASLLPDGVENQSQAEILQTVSENTSVPVVDIISSLREHTDEYIFYRTDHHWTTLGAFYAYQALGPALGYAPRGIDAFRPETVSRNFCGTTYSSSGFFWVEPDEMQIFLEPPAGVSVERFQGFVGEPASLYDYDMLSTKDKYRFFLGGNTPRAVIHTGNEGLPSLLILRDSYTDSLVPFLLAHFSEIHLLDLRYYLDSVSDYVETQGIDSVLVLYGLPNFCGDDNLALMTR